MTLPSRRKHPTIAPSFPATTRIRLGRFRSRQLAVALVIAAGCLASDSARCLAQGPNWSPQPFVPSKSIQPLRQPTSPSVPASTNHQLPWDSKAQAAFKAQADSRTQADFKAQANSSLPSEVQPAVVLRWKRSSLANIDQRVVLAGHQQPLPQSPAQTPPSSAFQIPAFPAPDRAPSDDGLQSTTEEAIEDRSQEPSSRLDRLPSQPKSSFGDPSNPMSEDDADEAAPAPPKLGSDEELVNPFRDRQSTDSDDAADGQGDDDDEKESDDDTFTDCKQVRQRLLADNIVNVRLNTAPMFPLGEQKKSTAESKRQEFAKNAPSRPWYDHRGRFVVDASLSDLINDQVILSTASGTTRRIQLQELSDADLVYVSEVWGLPIACTLGDQDAPNRDFVPATVQWRSSGLCHKPLYFEDVQLERYGHEVGPVLQPVLSTAHFFGNIAVLPYKMGIHPPNECQYALGYYRPGNCAPWTVGPVPISLRGGLFQAAAVTGIVGAIP